MANQFQIVIAAVDKATATVRKVNQSFGMLTRPIGQVKAATASLSKEMGLDRVAKGMVDVGRAAANVGEKVAGIVAPMAAVAGVGSIAAVAALATEWGKLGAEIGRTSATIGVSTDRLQALRGAARVSGVSAEGLTSGLKNLGDTMQDALYGRNQQAMVMMNRLGLRMKTTSDGAVDTTAAFGDLATAISNIKNPQVQGLVARTFGLEDMLPLLRQGKVGIAELEDQVKKTGAVMSGPAVAAAQSFQKSMGFLELSLEGLKNSIGEKLIPIVQPLVDQLQNWIAANRDLIATRVGEFATGVAEAIKQIDWGAVAKGARDLATNIKDLVDWMGGWKNAAIAVAVVMNGSLIASVLNLGTSLIKLGVEIIPVVVRALGALAVAGESTMLPALAQGAMKIAVFAEGLAGIAAGIPIVETALSAVSGAFLALGAAIEATPIGWIITGIAAVAAAVYVIYENWGAISAWWSKLWSIISRDTSNAWKTIQDTISSAGDSIIGGLKTAWTEFTDFWKGLWKGLVDTVKDAADFLSPIIEKITNGVRAVSGAARKVASAVGRTAGKVASTVSEGVQNFVAGTPIGIRQNNPGNLRSWGNAPINKGYAQFNTAAEGISAMAGNLQAYGRHGWNSIESIVSHWAPSGDNNNVPAYIADLVKQTGFGASAKLDLSDPKVLNALIPAIIKHENGKNPYDAGMIAQAISSRLGQPVPVPTAPTVAQGQPVATPYSAPATAAPTAAAPATPGAVPAGEPANVNVKVSFEGAPPGTRVQTDAQGAAAAQTRVSYAMPVGFAV